MESDSEEEEEAENREEESMINSFVASFQSFSDSQP
jgi:hypothetical protein